MRCRWKLRINTAAPMGRRAQPVCNRGRWGARGVGMGRKAQEAQLEGAGDPHCTTLLLLHSCTPRIHPASSIHVVLPFPTSPPFRQLHPCPSHQRAISAPPLCADQPSVSCHLQSCTESHPHSCPWTSRHGLRLVLSVSCQPDVSQDRASYQLSAPPQLVSHLAISQIVCL